MNISDAYEIWNYEGGYFFQSYTLLRIAGVGDKHSTNNDFGFILATYLHVHLIL